MSKSLTRVTEALKGVDVTILETPASTRTAAEAAAVAGCVVDQIVKSILFQGTSGRLYLFLTAGGHQVDAAHARLERADDPATGDATVGSGTK